jgi:hypothetical protein
MRSQQFVIETLSHFARDVKGPPPGVPFAADAEFETDLVALCEHQRLSAMVSASFDQLALPPTMSRITIARLSQHAEVLGRRSERRAKLAVEIVLALTEAGVRTAILGDVWAPALDAAPPGIRPVGWIDVMIPEANWSQAVSVLREMGFVRSRIQPRLTDSTQALLYHQYFASLVMHNRDGDAVRLRFRVVDFGEPGRDNPAWDRVETARGGQAPAPVVGPEDQLIHTLVSFASEGFVELLDVLDAGRILTRHGPTLDWEYLSERLKQRGFYGAFYFTLERVCELLNMQLWADHMAAPPSWRRRVFHTCWRPRDVDFYGETEPSGGRFAFGFVEGGGALARARWLRHALFPRSAWVRSVYGRPSNVWLRLKFLHDVRSGRRRRNADTAEVQGTVTGINELR